ncbi:hypothetical protein [Saccharothrix obliqua]|uniref:hypothetical protein n=1 Tax=Saccharothrix obliqua TaxID=2861747 RepID=UPI001C5E8C2A|nr:hypothetical protein [Saccharothrix obliqua]MBW4719706.1 hypothetical protein [Saccharothrix obliqua]
MSATDRAYLLVLPKARLPVDPGDRDSALAEIREALVDVARSVAIPPLGRCAVRLCWTVADDLHRTSEQVEASARACADALAAAGVATTVVDHPPRLNRGAATALLVDVRAA